MKKDFNTNFKPLSIVCCVAITLSFCNSNHQKQAEQNIVVGKKDTVKLSVDSSFLKFKNVARLLDSNLSYGRMSKEMEAKMNKAEADYYRTKNEKYYRLFYKYRDEQWRYTGLANKFYDSLQATKNAE